MESLTYDQIKEIQSKYVHVLGGSGEIQTKEFCAHTFSPKDSVQLISYSNTFTMRFKGKYFEYDHGNFLVGYVAYDKQVGK